MGLSFKIFNLTKVWLIIGIFVLFSNQGNSMEEPEKEKKLPLALKLFRDLKEEEEKKHRLENREAQYYWAAIELRKKAEENKSLRASMFLCSILMDKERSQEPRPLLALAKVTSSPNYEKGKDLFPQELDDQSFNKWRPLWEGEGKDSSSPGLKFSRYELSGPLWKDQEWKDEEEIEGEGPFPQDYKRGKILFKKAKRLGFKEKKYSEALECFQLAAKHGVQKAENFIPIFYCLEREKSENCLGSLDPNPCVTRIKEKKRRNIVEKGFPESFLNELLIDGNGMEGLTLVLALKNLEDTLKEYTRSFKIHENFDLIRGYGQMGGVIALGLTASLDGKNPVMGLDGLIKLFTEYRSKIFPILHPKKDTSGMSQVWSLKSGRQPLEEIFRNFFKTLTLKDVLTDVMIPVYTLEEKGEKIKSAFKSWKARESDEDNYELWQIARVSSASYSYLPVSCLSNVTGKQENKFFPSYLESVSEPFNFSWKELSEIYPRQFVENIKNSNVIALRSRPSSEKPYLSEQENVSFYLLQPDETHEESWWSNTSEDAVKVYTEKAHSLFPDMEELARSLAEKKALHDPKEF